MPSCRDTNTAHSRMLSTTRSCYHAIMPSCHRVVIVVMSASCRGRAIMPSCHRVIISPWLRAIVSSSSSCRHVVVVSSCHHCVSQDTLGIIFHWRGSVYGKTLYYSVPATLLAFMWDALRYWETVHADWFTTMKNYPYSIFTFILGFVLVFRSQLAYQRFWGSRSSLEQMSNNWADSVIKCVSFDRVSNLPEESIRLWRTKTISMYSLLHGVALDSLRHKSNSLDNKSSATMGHGRHDDGFVLPVLKGLDESLCHQLSMGDVEDETYLVRPRSCCFCYCYDGSQLSDHP